MTRASLYNTLRIPVPSDGVDRQIQSFTEQALRRSYAAQLRAEAASLGRPVPARRLTDPQALQTIHQYATDEARRIPQVYNDKLKAAIDKLPDGLTDEQMHAQLQPFFAGTHRHNSQAVVPTQTAWSRQQATRDFASRNGIEAQWTLDRKSGSTLEDDCQDVVEASPLTTDEMAALDGPPFHPRCQCGWESDVDESSVPDELWTGGDTAGMSRTARMLQRLFARFAHEFDEGEWQRDDHGRFEAYVGGGASSSGTSGAVTTADGNGDTTAYDEPQGPPREAMGYAPDDERSVYYHVVPNDYQHGDDILSYDDFEQKYGVPPSSGDRWAQETPDYLERGDTDIVSMFTSGTAAEGFRQEFGGKVLQIDMPAHVTVGTNPEGYPFAYRVSGDWVHPPTPPGMTDAEAASVTP